MIQGNFNKLTPAEAERLALLAEECGEVIRAIGKILRHGYDSYHPLDPNGPSNRLDLERELGNVQHAVDRLVASKDLSRRAINHNAKKKAETVTNYLHHQMP